MLRRTLLAVSAAFSAGAAFAADKVGIRPETVPSSAEYPRLRAGTQLDHLYESMLANGFGIKNPKASSDLPSVVIVSDTQCPWCSRLWNATMPLTDKVNFVWYLVPVLRDLSISQAALILSSSNPWEKYGEHELRFKDAGFRGLNPEGIPVDQKYRDEVWTNAKIARWSGVTSVPLGVYKNKAGKYIPIFSGSSTEQIEEVIFGKPK